MKPLNSHMAGVLKFSNSSGLKESQGAETYKTQMLYTSPGQQLQERLR